MRKNSHKLEAALISIGSFKSVCECLSIQTALAILNSLGYKDLEVEINSIGDKESAVEFQKKLAAFVRKNMDSFSSDLRQLTKKSIFNIFKGDKEELKNFEAEMPRPIDFLSEPSRLHFKEVLEFLEVMGICYKINHFLVGDAVIGSETVFSIKENGGQELGSGFRFNRLAKKIGFKKEVPATILNISAKLIKKPRTIKLRADKPKFYLVQFGPEAKLKSFIVLDELCRAGVSVVHSIAKDKLGSQMGVAENSDALYILLMGQKEALENSIVIRNTLTRAQEIVSLTEFSTKIKELE
jgi:histidyl-tRNA synthetase